MTRKMALLLSARLPTSDRPSGEKLAYIVVLLLPVWALIQNRSTLSVFFFFSFSNAAQ